MIAQDFVKRNMMLEGNIQLCFHIRFNPLLKGVVPAMPFNPICLYCSVQDLWEVHVDQAAKPVME